MIFPIQIELQSILFQISLRNLSDGIQQSYPENPCCVQESRRYLPQKASYCLFCFNFSLPWQQGLIVNNLTCMGNITQMFALAQQGVWGWAIARRQTNINAKIMTQCFIAFSSSSSSNHHQSNLQCAVYKFKTRTAVHYIVNKKPSCRYDSRPYCLTVDYQYAEPDRQIAMVRHGRGKVDLILDHERKLWRNIKLC